MTLHSYLLIIGWMGKKGDVPGSGSAWLKVAFSPKENLPFSLRVYWKTTKVRNEIEVSRPSNKRERWISGLYNFVADSLICNFLISLILPSFPNSRSPTPVLRPANALGVWLPVLISSSFLPSKISILIEGRTSSIVKRMTNPRTDVTSVKTKGSLTS